MSSSFDCHLQLQVYLLRTSSFLGGDLVQPEILAASRLLEADSSLEASLKGARGTGVLDPSFGLNFCSLYDQIKYTIVSLTVVCTAQA